MKKNNISTCFSTLKWFIVLGVIIFPFVLNSIIAQQVWPYWNVAGDANSWICFWGAYAGAIGTMVMAFIAMKTLKANTEQLEIIQQQNRPYLFCSVFILCQYNYDSKHGEETYYFRIENQGTQIAKQVKAKIAISDKRLLTDPLLKKNIDSIERSSFSLPAKGEKNFVLCKAIPNLTQQESKQARLDDLEQQREWIEQLKSSYINATLSCEGYDDEHETIMMNSVGYLPTTIVQILDSINHSIKNLSAPIDGSES